MVYDNQESEQMTVNLGCDTLGSDTDLSVLLANCPTSLIPTLPALPRLLHPLLL